MQYNSKIQQVIEKANLEYDGHLTIMKFTTEWKGMFGTPNLLTGGWDEVGDLKSFESLEALLTNLVNQQEYYCHTCVRPVGVNHDPSHEVEGGRK